MDNDNGDVGRLGYWHRGTYVVGIHADWPAYPGPGTGNALYDVCQFPHGTVFTPIDDIDRCVLFIASRQPPHANVWSENAFHIAIWHSDLIEMGDERLLDGIITVTEIEWRKAKRDEHRAELRRLLEAQGAVIRGDPLDLAYAQVGEDKYPLSDFYNQIERDELLEDSDYPPSKDHVIFDPANPVKVTPKGWIELERLMQDEPILSRFEHLRRLTEMEMYDTAIRDAGVLLETALREATGSSRYGIQLVDVFIKKLEADKEWPNSAVKRFRTDLRTAFKFVRNEFAHQIVEVPQDRAFALLVRLASLIESVKESN
jgi:hypothetical protein